VKHSVNTKNIYQTIESMTSIRNLLPKEETTESHQQITQIEVNFQIPTVSQISV
jgi:hypothetical protein